MTGGDVDRLVTAPADVVAAGHVVELRLKKIEDGGVIGDREVGRGGTEEVRGSVVSGAGGGGRSGGMVMRERH